MPGERGVGERDPVEECGQTGNEMRHDVDEKADPEAGGGQHPG